MRAKRTVFGLLAPLCFVGTLSACNQNYDDQRSNLADLLKGHQIGSTPDYWLVKRNMGVDDPVALVFGLLGDLKFCEDVADLYMSKYPANSYACAPAN